MPSPFPGMNPYLEQPDVWSDFHERWIPAAAEELERQLGDAYFVRVNQNVYSREPDGDSPDQAAVELVGRPDVFVGETAQRSSTLASPTSGATPAPTQVLLREVEEEESFLEIVDARKRDVITVIELLSPTIKIPGPKRDQYLSKRRRIQASTSHLVEFDFLRGHPRLPLRRLPVCDYYIMVSPAEKRPKAELWPLTLRDPLPNVPVPLRAPDTNISPDLQALLHRVYDAAGYRKYIYTTDPEPPLPAGDAEWARVILATAT